MRPLNCYVQAAGLIGSAGSVVVDVYDAAAPGALVATIPNGSVSRLGTSDTYQVNLAVIAGIGYPAAGDPREKHYVLNFRDDASSSSWVSKTVLGLAGAHALSGRCERATPVYPDIPIPSRGVTQAVINAGKPSYVKIEVSAALDFETPDLTYYEVYRYDSSGRVLSRTPSTTIPEA